MAITTRTERATGVRRTVGRADELALDSTDGAWVTVCEAHGAIVNSRTRRLAEASSTADFCDDCRKAAREAEGVEMGDAETRRGERMTVTADALRNNDRIVTSNGLRYVVRAIDAGDLINVISVGHRDYYPRDTEFSILRPHGRLFGRCSGCGEVLDIEPGVVTTTRGPNPAEHYWNVCAATGEAHTPAADPETARYVCAAVIRYPVNAAPPLQGRVHRLSGTRTEVGNGIYDEWLRTSGSEAGADTVRHYAMTDGWFRDPITAAYVAITNRASINGEIV